MRKRFNSYIPGVLLFAIFLAIGLWVYKDYGMSWDERTQRDIGHMSYNSVFNNDTAINNSINRDYGVGFELPLIFLEKWMHLEDEHDVYLMRHLVTHIFFLLSVLCLYILVFRLTRNTFLACAAFLALVLTPRMYAHSFFNTKDIPLLAMFIISFLVTQIAFEKKKAWWFMLMGVAWGYTTSIRISAIIPLFCIIIFMLIDTWRGARNKERIRPFIINLVLFLAFYAGFTILCWPRLWAAPVNNFLMAYDTFSRYGWHGWIRFNGNLVDATQLPWYYAPEYMLITIPELLLLSGIAGTVWLTYQAIRKPGSYLQNTLQRNYLLYLACFAGPIAAVVILHSTLYDDWRHLYFTYPSFILMAVFAWHQLMQTKARRVVLGICALQIILAAFMVIRTHPFQQVYFNRFVSHSKDYLQKNYEMDYWGPSFKQGLEFILAHDSSDQIKLHITDVGVPLANNVFMLPAEQRKRFVMVEAGDDPKYYLTIFRAWAQPSPYPNIYHDIEVHNSPILRIYKIHD